MGCNSPTCHCCSLHTEGEDSKSGSLPRRVRQLRKNDGKGLEEPEEVVQKKWKMNDQGHPLLYPPPRLRQTSYLEKNK